MPVESFLQKVNFHQFLLYKIFFQILIALILFYILYERITQSPFYLINEIVQYFESYRKCSWLHQILFSWTRNLFYNKLQWKPIFKNFMKQYFYVCQWEVSVYQNFLFGTILNNWRINLMEGYNLIQLFIFYKFPYYSDTSKYFLKQFLQ